MVTLHESVPPDAFDVERVRRDFPILARPVRGKKLVYLDSAATTQKPRQVVEAMARYFDQENANVHRGVHFLSERATEAYEGARERVRKFLNARHASEIVFVRGTTEALNLVAFTFGRLRVGVGDEVLLTAMEHHSNIVPWQMLCADRGAKLVVAPIDDRGVLLLDELEKRIGPRTKLLGVTHVSNALGTVNPLKQIVALAHARGVPVVVDGAQGAPHVPADVRDLDCDFYAFSGHKIYGPTGIGVLYGKAEHLEAMPPWQGGGDMILSVSFEKTTYNRVPYKFEAGTPNMAGAIGLGAALDWLEALPREAAWAHEDELLAYGTEALSRIRGLRLVGTAPGKAAVLSFVFEDIHPHDIGTVLDREGVAIRTGHHCAQPLMQRLGIAATARASLGIYNTRGEIDALVAGLEKVRRMFA
ncbi:MAG: cysteine sulfinate desulfinase [Anaeromyxobacter sp. RBG_16_69_14]|nr:MAG: cysteine sulfinate desulfinase [Anaeromyxobacter sp. RBG_16_69_14]